MLLLADETATSCPSESCGLSSWNELKASAMPWLSLLCRWQTHAPSFPPFKLCHAATDTTIDRNASQGVWMELWVSSLADIAMKVCIVLVPLSLLLDFAPTNDLLLNPLTLTYRRRPEVQVEDPGGVAQGIVPEF